jgi:hypothetical protein
MAQVRRKQPNVLLIAQEVARQLLPGHVALLSGGGNGWRRLAGGIAHRRILRVELERNRRSGKQEKCEKGPVSQKGLSL